MKNIEAKVQEFFANNPEADKVFSTSDEFLFDQEIYATQHAATLTDKDVVKHTNRNTADKVEINKDAATAKEVAKKVTTKTTTTEKAQK